MRPTAEKGFTLIEVLVAVAILAVAMMSIFAIYTQCTVELRRAKNRTIATNLAQQMLEMIWSTPSDIANYHGLTTASEAVPANPASADFLRWKTALQNFPTRASGTITIGAEPYLNVVTVAVKYDNYGRETSATLSVKLPRPSP